MVRRSMTYPLPESAQQTTAQAIRATTKAWEDGVSNQKVELLLPLIGATDLDDWYASTCFSCLQWVEYLPNGRIFSTKSLDQTLLTGL